MSKPIYVHPDNLIRGQVYKVVFKGNVLKKQSGQTIIEGFVIDAQFQKMMIATDDAPSHKKKVLAVVFRVPKEQYARVISWYRITHLEELSQSEMLKE